MQITLANLVDLAAASDADPALAEIPLDLREREGVLHCVWSTACAERAGLGGRNVQIQVGGVRARLCATCAADPSSLRWSCSSGGRDVVEAWTAARRWLSKPTRAGASTQVRRLRQVEEALRWARLQPSSALWHSVVVTDLQRMLPLLGERLPSRESALAEARALVAAEVGGDVTLLDETPMLVAIRPSAGASATTEVLTRSCALRREERLAVLALPAWGMSYLMRTGTEVVDFAHADTDGVVVATGVALYAPGECGPQGLLCAALATSRDVLSP